MNDPKTIVEKIDAAANLVEQMQMAHMIHDTAHFIDCHRKASTLLFDALRQCEDQKIE